ncbi:MAG: efflux RND transporter periplasmic adaptor subunit [Cyclobacteriaceae bacterium]|nr:efflux RND transporter periplasmic adaptor subunit [Cyclobacteriaceae bacterium]
MEQSTETSSRKIIIGGLALLILIAAGVVLLFFKQRMGIAAEREVREAKVLAGPTVKVTKAALSKGGREFTLLGEVRPFQSVTLYARTSGYMDRINVDKGDVVTKGQVIATIIAPEIDQEYNSIAADVENKKKILSRDQSLLEKNFISSQEKEQSETALRMSEARLRSITEQKEYRTLRAPFSGTVTARYADAGALLQNATNASSGALPVVMISQLDKVRIYVYVEQKDASYIKVGYPVEVVLFENATEKISATVTRISGELDSKTKMMLTEIDLDNKDSKVIPGSFVQIRIQSPGAPKLQMPREALIIKDGKYFVATLNADNAIHFQSVKIGENTGDKITVLEGVTDKETIALNIGDSLEEGQKVIIKP